MATGACAQRKRRFKLLVWAENAQLAKLREGEVLAHMGVEGDASRLEDDLGEEIDLTMRSLGALAQERKLLAQQTEKAERSLAASRTKLVQVVRHLRDAGAPSSRLPGRLRHTASETFWLRTCVHLCEQNIASADEDHLAFRRSSIDGPLVTEALMAHARLARLFASFRQKSRGGLTNIELASSHLCSARLLQEVSFHLSEVMVAKDDAETNHCLGRAYLACGREHQLANMHADLAALYIEMSFEEKLDSYLSAAQLHLFKAADKFAHCRLLSRETQVMCAAGQVFVQMQDYEGALQSYSRALSTSLRVEIAARRSHRRRRWRTSMGTRAYAMSFDSGTRAYAMRVDSETIQSSFAHSHGQSGGGPGQARNADAGEQAVPVVPARRAGGLVANRALETACVAVRVSAAGVVEALVAQQRVGEALLVADRFLSDCNEDVGALLAVHQQHRGACRWVTSLEDIICGQARGDEVGSWARDKTGEEEDAECRGSTPALDLQSDDKASALHELTDQTHSGVCGGGCEQFLGGEGPVLARQMLDGCGDMDTCVVVLHVHVPTQAMRRCGQRVGGGAGDAEQIDAGDAEQVEPGHDAAGGRGGGYAWIFLAGERARPREGRDVMSAVPCRALCVPYTAQETARICSTASAFRRECGTFRGRFVGSVEHGISMPTEMREEAGKGEGKGGGMKESPSRLDALLQEISEAVCLDTRILPQIDQLGCASRLLLVASAALEGVPLGALPTCSRKPLWSLFEGRVMTAPSLAFACICRSLRREQQATLPLAQGGHDGTGSDDGAGSADGECTGVSWGRVVSVGAPHAVFSGWEAKKVLQAFEAFALGGELLSGCGAVVDDIRWAARHRCNPRAPGLHAAGLRGGGSRGRGVDAEKAGEGEGEVVEMLRNVMHLACHVRVTEQGVDGGRQGTSRGLLMADDEMLRSEEVRVWDLSRCWLVVMSACSSSLSCRVLDEPSALTPLFANSTDGPLPELLSRARAGGPGEDGNQMKLGLPGAFVHAGCPCVVGCLWEVAGASTVALMLTFYHVLLTGDCSLSTWPHRTPPSHMASEHAPAHPTCGDERVGVAEALTAAQQWLRRASMQDVCTLLPRSGHTAACLRVWGWRLDADLARCGRGKGSASIVGAGRKAGDGDRPFSSPFYWAGFVVMGYD